jgi:NDP-sugar pyrophosphorylase family protein
MPVGEVPLLEIVCRQLATAGFRHVTLALSYMSDYFRTFLAQRRTLRQLIAIDCIEEEAPLGTAGALAHIPDLPDTFLVMNGDILTTLDYRALVRYHRQHGAALTIATHETEVRVDLGVLRLNAEGEVTGYAEKPTLTYPTSMGIYVYERTALDALHPGEHLDFPALVLRLLAARRKVLAYASRAVWLDVGRPEDLVEAARLLRLREAEFLPPRAA